MATQPQASVNYGSYNQQSTYSMPPQQAPYQQQQYGTPLAAQQQQQQPQMNGIQYQVDANQPQYQQYPYDIPVASTTHTHFFKPYSSSSNFRPTTYSMPSQVPVTQSAPVQTPTQTQIPYQQFQNLTLTNGNHNPNYQQHYQQQQQQVVPPSHQQQYLHHHTSPHKQDIAASLNDYVNNQIPLNASTSLSQIPIINAHSSNN